MNSRGAGGRSDDEWGRESRGGEDWDEGYGRAERSGAGYDEGYRSGEYASGEYPTGGYESGEFDSADGRDGRDERPRSGRDSASSRDSASGRDSAFSREPGSSGRDRGEEPSRAGSERERSERPRSTAARVGGAREALSKAAHQPGAGAGRRLQVVVGLAVLLGAGLGYGYMVQPPASPVASTANGASVVGSATVACPIVTGFNDADIAAFSPVTGGAPASASAAPSTGSSPSASASASASASGKASTKASPKAGSSASASSSAGTGPSLLAPVTGSQAVITALGGTSPVLSLKQTGAIGTATGLSGNIGNLNQENVPVVGQAAGAFAPGFTVNELLNSGSFHGLAGTPCTAPSTDFWFIGSQLNGTGSIDQLNLFNTDAVPAEVNIAAYTADGPVAAGTLQADEGLIVPPDNQLAGPIDLGSIINAKTPVAVHLTAAAGRFVAAAFDSEGSAGDDYILAQQPSAHLVIPGIPAPAANAAEPMKLELTLLAPQSDTDVSLQWIGHSKITPTVTVPHLTAGHVEQVDLSSIPVSGEPAALQIDSDNNTPIIAELRLVAAGGSDIAYLGPAQQLTGQAIVAQNTSGAVVQLTNNSTASAQVTVTAVGASAGTPQTVTLSGQSTQAVTVQPPAGSTTFAIEVTPQAGAQDVYAARLLTAAGGLVTIQAMETALETVKIPAVRNDLSGVVPQP